MDLDRIDPYANDPLHWGASMAHHAELLLGCLDAIGAGSVIEIGAFAGDLTRVLAAWATDAGATVTAVDPAPQPQLEALADGHPEVTLVRETSLAALPRLAAGAGAIVIDGDHNYHTVAGELALIAEATGSDGLPLLFFHDVCWPHGRRDDYFDVSQIPAGRRHEPLVGADRGIAPDTAGTTEDGLPYPRSAAREGGPANGVLTAAEDFAAGDEHLRLVVVPAFFGFGVCFDDRAPWAAAVTELLTPWHASRLVSGLEANRVAHVAGEHALRVALWQSEERRSRQQALLERMLESRAFEVAELLSRLRVRLGIAPGQSIISRRQIRRALQD